MTNSTIGRWTLVLIAIVGIALAIPAVSAHGNDTVTDDGTTADWITWMEAHMTEHMGPGAFDWMESHTSVTVEEMGHGMADEGRTTGDGHC